MPRFPILLALSVGLFAPALLTSCGSSISGLSTSTTTTTSTIAAAPATLTTLQITQLSATVTNTDGAAYIAPSGNITFIGNSGSVLGISALTVNPDNVSATGTLTISGAAFATGANLVSSSYAGDTFHTSSVSTNITVTVSSAVTTVNTASVLVASLTNITEAESTVLTATVVAASGTSAPGGAVAFVDQSNGLTLGTAVLGMGSSTTSATAAIQASGSSMNVGMNTIVAEYQGNTSFAASTSGNATVTVAATTQAEPAAAIPSASIQVLPDLP